MIRIKLAEKKQYLKGLRIGFIITIRLCLLQVKVERM